jgi:aryl-alcohol dehydrogenase-like predicted oxidoreductase
VLVPRALGASGLLTPPLILGGNVFGWTADEAESFRVMDAFVAAGGTMIDTADVYSAWAPGHVGGESEEVIGRWLNRRGRGDDVLIATKVGILGGLGRSSVERAIEDSLRRLQTDYVDLYYTHRDDETIPLEETLEALRHCGRLMCVPSDQTAHLPARCARTENREVSTAWGVIDDG